jgi:hypothetical protein
MSKKKEKKKPKAVTGSSKLENDTAITRFM